MLPYNGRFRLTSIQGPRVDPFTKEPDVPHNGIDLVGLDSKYLLAPCEGEVIMSRIVTDPASATSAWGNYVTLRDNYGRQIIMAHLSQRLVTVGQRVKVGEHIGVEGSTGRSSGSHCHFEVRAIDGTTKLNAAEYIGIKNIVGTYGSEDSILIADYFGLSEDTVAYLQKYPYAADLFRKLRKDIT